MTLLWTVTIQVGDVLDFSKLDALFATYATAVVKSFVIQATSTTVCVAGQLPNQLAVGDWVVNEEIATAYVHGVTFKSNRQRGMLIQNKGTVVDSCKVCVT